MRNKARLLKPAESKIVIFGATGGLGQAVVEELCTGRREHSRLLCLCGRNAAVLEALEEKASAAGIDCCSFVCDLRDSAALSSLILELKALEINKVLLLSGISTTASEDGFEDLYEIERGFKVNVLSPIRVIYALGSALPPGSQIVVVSSIAALLPLPSTPVYSATKAALCVYINAVRPVFTKRGVYLSLVLPGFFASPMSDRFLGRQMFKISAATTARKILKIMHSGRAVSAFPLLLFCGARFLSMMPQAVQALFLQYFVRFKVSPDRDRRAYMAAGASTGAAGAGTGADQARGAGAKAGAGAEEGAGAGMGERAGAAGGAAAAAGGAGSGQESGGVADSAADRDTADSAASVSAPAGLKGERLTDGS